jgi:hypothetical protein
VGEDRLPPAIPDEVLFLLLVEGLKPLQKPLLQVL